MRVLRQLRDLRRYAPVVIQNAQQVNVGNQQTERIGVREIFSQRSEYRDSKTTPKDRTDGR